MSTEPSRILLTGATGYIGGRLAPRLLEKGYWVRCLVRDLSRLQGRAWREKVDVVAGDMLKPDTLAPAMHAIDMAYYLVHSMGGGKDFHQRDLEAARNFGKAALEAGVKRVIYLGGLAAPQSDLSEHLRSRQQTGAMLRQYGPSITEFQAAVIVGSGSLSFEMIRYLTERVPIMVCPRWVYTKTQPISINDVLDYLVSALEVPESTGQIIQIGGEKVVTYGDMMMGYARARGLTRWMVPVPVLTPRLSSYWINLVTPIPAVIARPLVDGLRNENIVTDDSARRLFPSISPTDYQTAVQRALGGLEVSHIETAWSDALSTSQGDSPPIILTTHEGMILEQRQQLVQAPHEDVFKVFTGIGGNRGWFYLNLAWELRGLVDRVIGGVGLRRGRRDPDDLRVGDALDFWRVEALEPGRLLRLRAEMILPGKAWLQFQVKSQSDKTTQLTQTAFFAPKGLLGLMYWYLLYPMHGLIFSGLIKQIAKKSVARAADAGSSNS
jgi:uncharacterized protein YbjT (DUF2867 family)